MLGKFPPRCDLMSSHLTTNNYTQKAHTKKYGSMYDWVKINIID